MDPGSGGQASGCGTATPLGRRWALEDLDTSKHAFATVGTQTQTPGQEIEERRAVIRVLGVRVTLASRLTEGLPAAREELGAGSIGEKAVVTDPDEALGQDVEEEAADELPKRKGQRSGATAAVILEAEGGGPVIDMKKPVVGDRDAVRVAGKILQDVIGAVEGRLGIDDPLGGPCLVEEPVERCRVPVSNEAAVQVQPPISERLGEFCQELAPKETAEHTDGQEEAGAARLPGASVLGQPTRRNHAVDVGMMDEGLAPGVEDGKEPEASPEMARVLGDLLKRPGRGAEQEAVDDLGVLEGEGCKGLRQGEDHVGIGHCQHLGLARFEPAGLGAALTLRAVAVAARVVGNPLLPAGVALVDMPPQPRRTAGQDPVNHLTLLPAPMGHSPGRELGIEVPPEDLRDLVPRSPGHLLEDHELWAQRIQWTPRPAHPLRRHVRVDRRGPQRAVTQ